MAIRKFNVSLKGSTGLLLHADSIEWADRMEAWKNDPANKTKSKAGDDRTPAHRWIGCLYRGIGEDTLHIANGNIMRCLMEGGAMVPVPGGKGGKTFKAQTQSGMMTEKNWQLSIAGKTIPWKPINDLLNESDFEKHQAAVKTMGFDLMVKRAAINKAKHIRVRPLFHTWEASGQITVWDEQLTDKILAEVFAYAGRYKGLGDWRPGSKTPGSYGMFEATISKA